MSASSLLYIAESPWVGLVSVSPQRIEKRCQLGQQEFLTLTVKNETDGLVAWKLKTNRPGRYMVRHVTKYFTYFIKKYYYNKTNAYIICIH